MTPTDLILQWSFAAMVGLVLTRRSFALFHPATLYWGMHVVLFCIRPAIIQGLDLDATWQAMHFTPEPEQLRLALLASSAALLVFVSAALLTSRSAVSAVFPEPRDLDSSDVRGLGITALIFAPVGLFALVQAHGSRASGLDGYADDLRVVLLPIALLVLLAAHWRWWSYAPIALVILLGGRAVGDTWTIILGATLVLLLWLWDRQRTSAPLGAIAVATCAALLTAGVLHNPGQIPAWLTSNESAGPSFQESPTLLERFGSPDFTAFDTLTYVIAVVPEKSRTHTFGTQHLARWPSLRSTLGHLEFVTEHRVDLSAFGRSPDRPVSLVADSWLTAGWPGLFGVMVAAGAICGYSFRRLSRDLGNPAVACFYLIAVVSLGHLVRDSSLSMLALVAFTAAPLWVWHWLGRRLRAARAAAEVREGLREKREQRRILGHAILNPQAASLPAFASEAHDSGETTDISDPGDLPAADLPDGSSPSQAAGLAPSPAEGGEEPPPAPMPRPRWRSED